MKTEESRIKAEIVAYLKSLGPDCWYDNNVRTGYGRRGVPDILCCYKGRFVALEVKVPGKRPSSWQKREIDAIEASGGEAWVICSVDHAKTIFETLDDVL